MNSGTYRLAHLSDLHLGYRSGKLKEPNDLNAREMDGYRAFARIVKEVIAEEVDGVVICGDIYHSPSPSIHTHVFAQKQLRRLADAGIPVYMLAGNHDTDDIRANVAASRILDDPFRGIYSHAEPYVRHEIADGIHLHLVSHHAYSLQTDTMKEIRPVPGEINIFATHGSCIDPLLQEKLKAESSPREIVIPDFLLMDEDWSYSMLGHIHERGWVGSSDKETDTADRRVYYNGSTIRRGFSDKKVPLGRGWTLWTIEPNGLFSPDIRTIAQRPQYDFTPINASEHSPSEITDLILKNLKSTQIESNAPNYRTAPILRQKILNLTPAKQAGLDLESIGNESRHALDWKLKLEWKLEGDISVDKDSSKQNDSVDILSAFDDWVEDSETYKGLEETSQELVKKETRDFVSLGQDRVLEEE